jgi:hypothetical protein
MPSPTESGPVSRPGEFFARWVFLLAGIVGLLEVLPLYFAEDMIGRRQPPAINHPEFYYGFVGIVIAWQVAFLIISRDPLRYRPLMPAIFLEKLLYPGCVIVLYLKGRFPANAMGAAMLDLVWLALFVAVWLKTKET